MSGTLINVGAILAGSVIGLLIGKRLPVRVINTTYQGLGLFILMMAIMMGLKGTQMILILASLAIGAIIGELLDLDGKLARAGDVIKRRLKGPQEHFIDGFVTSTMLFCVGSMAILGSMEEGLGSEPKLLLAKSMMDCVAAMALSVTFGVSVLFSVIPVLIYQGGITLFAGSISPYLGEPIVAEMTGVGGILMIGIGLNILGVTKIKLMNLLPSLVVIVILMYIFR